MDKKMHYYVPGFYKNAAIYALLADFMANIPQWFYEDVQISAAYGCFPNCIWNGGRTLLGEISKTTMIRTIEELNKRGIAVRYTFTNPLLEEKHMGDIFANICLEVANNGMNEVLVNSPILEEYVRKNYPNFKLISSTTKCLKTVEEVKQELDKDYYLVVLDSTLNKDEDIFKLEKRDRLELLVDHGCRVDCPNRVDHYIACGTAQLNYDHPKFHRCVYVERSFEELKENGSFISRELLEQKYMPGGFQHFKLDGRSFEPEKLVDSLMYYFVKPEFRTKVKSIIKTEIYDKFQQAR